MRVLQYLGRLALCFALGAPSAVALAREEGSLVLEPASPWVIHRAEDSCAVQRAFRAGDDEVLLELRRFGPDNLLQVTLVSDTLARPRETPRVRFEPDDEFLEPQTAFFFEHGDAHGVLYTDNLVPNALRGSGAPEWTDADWEKRELAITGLTVNGVFERDLALQTGRLFAPMADLRDCTDELLERWGMDANIQHTLERPAIAVDFQTWVRRIQERYPARQQNMAQSGVAIIRLIVGADGKPSKCIPNNDAPDHSFDEQACEVVMRYARFDPALDANGVPTEAFWATRIFYRTEP